ncbi:MAG: twin-arginine translocase TatA/TatE family subunit [Conexivisphaera sp.]
MLGSLTDALVVVVVAILLLSGERDLSGHLREIGKFVGNLRRSEQELRRELSRELNLGELNLGELAGIGRDAAAVGLEEPPARRPPQPRRDDERVRELEEEVRRLRAEIEELRRRAGGGEDHVPS